MVRSPHSRCHLHSHLLQRQALRRPSRSPFAFRRHTPPRSRLPAVRQVVVGVGAGALAAAQAGGMQMMMTTMAGTRTTTAMARGDARAVGEATGRLAEDSRGAHAVWTATATARRWDGRGWRDPAQPALAASRPAVAVAAKTCH